MTYYGQFETDKIIDLFFNKKTTGNAIEVGASHGISASNTKHFEDKGWTCMCIEPNPELYAQLRKNRPHAVKYAVGSENRDNVPFAIVTLEGGDTTAISSLEIDQKLFKQHKVKEVKEVKVNLRTLDFILEEFKLFEGKQLDFVSIDTEGTELEVLKGFDLNKWRPKLLVIEDNYDTEKLDEYLEKFSYVKDQRVGVNNFYVYQYNNTNVSSREPTKTKRVYKRSKTTKSTD